MAGMQRLRILQVFNRYLHFGGEEGSVFRIGDALQELYDVEYFFGSTADFFGKDLTSLTTAPWRAFYDRGVAARLRRYQEVGKFDCWLIHNIFPGLSPSVYLTGVSLEVPMIHYLHNYRFGCVNGSFLNHGHPCQRCLAGNFWPAFSTACWHNSRLISGWQALILLYLRRLDVRQLMSRWIALSGAQKMLHLKMGFPGKHIAVVPHFYEPKEIPPPLDPQGAVLFLARLSPEKGGQEILNAWGQVSPATRELWIGGTGPEEDLLRKQAAAFPSVRFLGFLDVEGQKRAWAGSSFAVIPSIVPETFGMIVLEAWARQRPVVAYRIGALAENIDDGVNGVLVEPGNASALAEAIRRLSRDPERIRKMGLAGYEKLKTVFNRKVWLQSMQNIFQTSLPRKPAPPVDLSR